MTKTEIVKKLGLINKLKNELKNRGSRDLEVRILIFFLTTNLEVVFDTTNSKFTMR